MGFKAFLRSWLMSGTDNGEELTPSWTEGQKNELSLGVFASCVAIQKIATAISKCEIVTYVDHKKSTGAEWYMWNVRPNRNENAVEFKRHMITTLLKNGEVLIIETEDGQLLIADGYSRNKEYALYGDEFTNVTVRGYTFSRTFKTADVIFIQYDNLRLRSWLNALQGQYNALLKLSASKYRRAGGRKWLARVGKIEEGDERRKAQVDELFSSRFKQFFDAEDSVLALPKNIEVEPDKSESGRRTTSEVNDIQAFSREIFSRAGQAFGVPLSVMMSDVADSRDARLAFYEFACDPIIALINAEIQCKRYSRQDITSGTYAVIDKTGMRHVDPLSEAASMDKIFADGLYSIDELRAMIGDEPLNTQWSAAHYLTKNYERIDLAAEGGEAE